LDYKPIELGTYYLQSQLNGSVPPLMFITGAHGSPFIIAKEGKTHGTWDVALVIFPGTPDIQDRSRCLQKGASIKALGHG